MKPASMSHRRPHRRRSATAKSRAALGIAVLLVAFAFVPSALHASAAPHDDAGEAGTVTGLPATSSAVTVSEPNTSSTSAFPNLKVSVNQTQNLVNQDISITWTGGTQTVSGTPGDFNGDYLQMFECWGDPETTYPDDASDPGPPPSQCEFGGESSTPTSSYPVQSIGWEYSRVLTESGWDTYDDLESCTSSPSAGSTSDCQLPGYSNLYNDSKDGFVIEPFDAVDGTSVGQQADYAYDQNPLAPQSFWLNPYFSFDTTNEVDFSRTYSGGTGNQLFQVDTGLEAPGLGCGQNIEPTAGEGTTTPQCWLVVVPRSTASLENPAGVSPSAVTTSPLTPEAWANRIAIPLGFNPVGSSCAINAATEGIEGSELASEAVASWQPALCDQSSSTSYSYVENDDDQARENLTNPTYGSVGMSVFSNPIDPSQTTPTNPVVYAPLTLSGTVIGFNIERVPAVVNGTSEANEVPLEGTRIATINLTPRLVAKLLTESYKGQFEELNAEKPGSNYDWVQNNPETLFSDPDFLQYNPEFADLTTEQQVDSGTLLVEEASSDAAATLWKWVLSDPSAKSWLAGNPVDGMCVNPNYVTSSDSTCFPKTVGAFGTPAPENFPKNDSYCETISGADEPPIVTGTGSSQTSTPARPLCILDWSPYAGTMKAAAQDASEANDQAKTTYSPTAASADAAWGSNGPQTPGTYVIMTVTDSASADLYGLQSASLSRSGDDPTTGSPTFVTPTPSTILAGEQAMTPSAVPGVLQTNVSTTATSAYPLTMLTYAATTPETLSAGDRTKYAAFIRYAVQAGQVNGPLPGQLPTGYVPLPSSLQSEALTAADTILNPPNESGPAAAPAAKTSSPALPEQTPFVSSVPPPTATTTTTPAPTVARKHPIRSLGPAALTSLRTHGFPIGVLRWVLPLALFIGLLAGLGGLLLGRFGRKPAVARPSPIYQLKKRQSK